MESDFKAKSTKFFCTLSLDFPGTYPLTVGMQLKDAIKASGGLKNATYGSEIEISRSSDAGKKYAITQSFVSLSDPQAMASKLQEMDLITLKQEISSDLSWSVAKFFKELFNLIAFLPVNP